MAAAAGCAVLHERLKLLSLCSQGWRKVRALQGVTAGVAEVLAGVPEGELNTGPGEGQEGRHQYWQRSDTPRVALPLSWDDLVMGCSAWHSHNLSTPFLEQEVMQGEHW